MKPFTHLSAIAAPLPLADVDTDKILPGRFLKTITREGLGAALFHALRYDAADNERPDFILNIPPYRDAQILLTLNNFGCGSSREHAPWALLDFGIRCIIAPSFADIFYNNCFKNGILPIALHEGACLRLIAHASTPHSARLEIDLPKQLIRTSVGETIDFAIDPDRKDDLMSGRDAIAQTFEAAAAIAAYERTLNTMLVPPIPQHLP